MLGEDTMIVRAAMSPNNVDVKRNKWENAAYNTQKPIKINIEAGIDARNLSMSDKENREKNFQVKRKQNMGMKKGQVFREV